MFGKITLGLSIFFIYLTQHSLCAELIASPGERFSLYMNADFEALSKAERKILFADSSLIEFPLDIAKDVNDPNLFLVERNVEEGALECGDASFTGVSDVPEQKRIDYYIDLISGGFGLASPARLVSAFDENGTLFIQSWNPFGNEDGFSALDIKILDGLEKKTVSRINVSSMLGPIKTVFEATRPNGRLVDTENGLRVLLNDDFFFLRDQLFEITLVLEGAVQKRIGADRRVSLEVSTEPHCVFVDSTGKAIQLTRLAGGWVNGVYRVRVPVDLDIETFLNSFLYSCPKVDVRSCTPFGQVYSKIGRVFVRVEKFVPLYAIMPVDDFGSSHHSYRSFFRKIVEGKGYTEPELYLPEITKFSDCKNEVHPLEGALNQIQPNIFLVGFSGNKPGMSHSNTSQSNSQRACGRTVFNAVSEHTKTVRLQAVKYRSDKVNKPTGLGDNNRPVHITKVCSEIDQSTPADRKVFWSIYIEGPFCETCRPKKKYDLFQKNRLENTFFEDNSIPLVLSNFDKVCVEAELGQRQALYIVPIELSPSKSETFFIKDAMWGKDLFFEASPANSFYFQKGLASTRSPEAIMQIDLVFPKLQLAPNDIDNQHVKTMILSITLCLVVIMLLWLTSIPIILIISGSLLYVGSIIVGYHIAYLSFVLGFLASLFSLNRYSIKKQLFSLPLLILFGFFVGDVISMSVGIVIVIWFKGIGMVVARYDRV